MHRFVQPERRKPISDVEYALYLFRLHLFAADLEAMKKWKNTGHSLGAALQIIRRHLHDPTIDIEKVKKAFKKCTWVYFKNEMGYS